LRGFVMAAQPRQSWSSCDLSGPDTPGPIRPLTPLPRQSPTVPDGLWIYAGDGRQGSGVVD
ncbi:hypothetical protein OSH32_26535, partial [Mycobacterium ulcerans]